MNSEKSPLRDRLDSDENARLTEAGRLFRQTLTLLSKDKVNSALKERTTKTREALSLLMRELFGEDDLEFTEYDEEFSLASSLLTPPRKQEGGRPFSKTAGRIAEGNGKIVIIKGK